MIRRAAEHDAVDFLEMLPALSEIGNSAIDDDRQVRILALDLIDEIVVERRHVAIFLRRQSIQPRLARMHDEDADAGCFTAFEHQSERVMRFLIVDTEAALDRHRNGDCCPHGGHALRHQVWLAHQTADIEVDLVIADVLGDLRGLGKTRRI